MIFPAIFVLLLLVQSVLIDDARLASERQSKRELEMLKNKLVESAKSELSQMKILHNKHIDDISDQFKTKVQSEKALVEITDSQAEQLAELKSQIAHLQLERATSRSDRKEDAQLRNKKADSQINVEEVMETIQNIEPIHSVVLASDDVSKDQDIIGASEGAIMYDLPKYETFSQGKNYNFFL